MKTLFKAFLILALGVVLLSVVGGCSLLHHVFSEPGVHITVNGDDWTDPDLGGVISAVLGLGVVGLMLFVVVPLVLIFAVGLPLLLVGGFIGFMVLLFCGVGAVVFSPAFLVILVLWLLLRRPKAREAGPAPRPEPPRP